MQIDVDIIRTRSGKILWADDIQSNPSGHGFVVYVAGEDVSDKWLEDNGLVDPEPVQEEVKPPAKKATAKQAPTASNKMASGPKNDK